jgi:large subunit ribosomal protein L24
MHIRSDDTVEIIAGNDRGEKAKVLRVIEKRHKLIVEGINRVYKHMRRSQRNPQGGRLSKEMPMDWSNVLLVCPQCGKATRTGTRPTADGGKERVCKECEAGIGLIAPPKSKKKTDAGHAR